MEQNKGIGERLRIVIGSKTLDEFAESIGITVRAVSNYLAGRIPKKSVRRDICSIYQIEESWLLTGEGPIYAEPETQKMGDVSPISDPQKIEDVLNAGRVYQELITALKGNVLLQGEIGRLLEDKFQLQTKINGLQEDLLRQVKEKEQAKQELARMTEKMEQMQAELARQTKKTLASDAEAPAQSRHSAKYMGSVGSVISGDVHGGTFQIENKGK